MLSSSFSATSVRASSQLARRHFPKTYREILKLRLPPYVKIILTNTFPRSHITTHLGRGDGRWFGHPGVEPALGLPPGPNSGLSVKLP